MVGPGIQERDQRLLKPVRYSEDPGLIAWLTHRGRECLGLMLDKRQVQSLKELTLFAKFYHNSHHLTYCHQC